MDIPMPMFLVEKNMVSYNIQIMAITTSRRDSRAVDMIAPKSNRKGGILNSLSGRLTAASPTSRKNYGAAKLQGGMNDRLYWLDN